MEKYGIDLQKMQIFVEGWYQQEGPEPLEKVIINFTFSIKSE